MATNSRKTTITRKIKPTDEDRILNDTQEDIIQKEVFDVFNKNVVYQVTNVQLGNKPSLMNGLMIKEFFGYDNQDAKDKLQTGAKEVIIFEKNNKDDEMIPLYKIEVVE